ncbi:MotE family protein [Mongoliimonas terrestris]|uniref:MotE family protein n=1 Tax=Mongoliimonas terrestris TaxID=1709001 RepID=UPI000949AEE4|nr:hypothetical protein [Mongoliimonas terrestris]
MVRLRLLPIVLFAVSALFALKLLGLATGVGSFGVGPAPAVAAGPAAKGGTLIDAPLDLRSEFQAQQKALEAAAKSAEKAEGGTEHAEAPHAETPADAAAVPPAETPPVEAHDAEAAAAAAPEAEAPAAAAPEAAAPAAADGHAQPAAAGEAGHGADGGSHDAPADPNNPVTTVRPPEYQPEGSKSETTILQTLSGRRSELDKREDDLMLRLKLLEAAEQRLQKRVDELKSIETQITAARQTEDTGAEERVKSLVTMYENMKPKAAAAVFDTLDLPILLDLAKTMQPKKMAAILAQMSPANAARLTTALAARRTETVAASPAGAIPGAPGIGQTEPGLDALPKIMPAGSQP